MRWRASCLAGALVGPQHHRHHPLRHLLEAPGVQGGDPARVPGGDRQEDLEELAAPRLGDHDPGWPLAQSLANEALRRDQRFPTLSTGRAHHRRLGRPGVGGTAVAEQPAAQLQLGAALLDGPDVLRHGDLAAERGLEGGLARARVAGDRLVEAGKHAASEELGGPLVESSGEDQVWSVSGPSSLRTRTVSARASTPASAGGTMAAKRAGPRPAVGYTAVTVGVISVSARAPGASTESTRSFSQVVTLWSTSRGVLPRNSSGSPPRSTTIFHVLPQEGPRTRA